MPKEKKEAAIKSQTESMAEAAQRLHVLNKKKRELESIMRSKEKNIEFSMSQSINKVREEERKKRIELYGKKEEQSQRVTSTLMLELMQICKEEDVPNYVKAIAKVLDNYQGSFFIYFLCSKCSLVKYIISI